MPIDELGFGYSGHLHFIEQMEASVSCLSLVGIYRI